MHGPHFGMARSVRSSDQGIDAAHHDARLQDGLDLSALTI